MNENEKAAMLLRQTALSLNEHFDSVLILATKHDPEASGGTLKFCGYAGNYFANYGCAKIWLLEHEQEIRRQTHENT